MSDVGAAGSGDLVVASYNIHRCVGTDRVCSPERIAEVLEAIDADVVGLQEVDSALPEHGIDQLAFLAKALGYHFVAGPTLILHRGQYGNAVLSRWPLRLVSRVDLSVGGHEPRGLVSVDADVPGGTLRVVATHFGLRRGERQEQARRLVSAVGEPHGPLTLLGDINEWLPRSRCLSQLDQRFGRSTGKPSFPSRRPFLALDRIWVRPGVALRAFAAHDSRLARVASDHLPVVARLDAGALFARAASGERGGPGPLPS